MDDIDILLSMVENPTRRRILESLVREPSYPLRLSKELGVSQQAVMKNLALMEQNGLVVSSRMDSSMGPMRIVYSPNTEFTLVVEMHRSMEFTLVVEMHRSMFSAKVIGPSGEIGLDDEGMTAEEASRRIDEIDGRIKELDEERAALVSERNSIMAVFGDSGTEEQATDGNIRKTIEREV